MLSTTRCTNWRTLCSRSGEPILPWKYLLTTMLVAVCDQSEGTSTSFCSKMIAPLSFPIAAVRCSQTISSYGVLPGSSFCVQHLGKVTPLRWALGRAFFDTLSNSSILTLLRATLRWAISSLSSELPGTEIATKLRQVLRAVCNHAPRCSVASRILSIYGAVGYSRRQVRVDWDSGARDVAK